MKRTSVVAVALLAIATVNVRAAEITVTVENLAPELGTFLTPVWVGFHDGSFDFFDNGSAASMSLERIAEDGDASFLNGTFAGSGGTSMQGMVFGPGDPPVLGPGNSGSMMFTLDEFAAESRYFSFASMVIPSNDAFIGNDDPMAHRIFEDDGTFIGGEFIVMGSQVFDARTEVNTELPMDTAFFGQKIPNTGPDENGVVHAHGGFNPPGSGGILDSDDFANADFTVQGYEVARITIVPEPASLALLMIGGVLVARRRRTA